MIGSTKMALVGGHTLGHSGGAHEMCMSPGSAWLPLSLSTTWSSWAGNTVKRDAIVKVAHSADTAGECDLGHLSLTLPYILLMFITLRTSKGLFLCVLWVAWFLVTGLMSNGRTLFMCRRKKMSSQTRSVDTKRGREPRKNSSSSAETRFTSKGADGVLGCAALSGIDETRFVASGRARIACLTPTSIKTHWPFRITEYILKRETTNRALHLLRTFVKVANNVS